MNLLEFTDCGIYCPYGDFYIDPWKSVKTAVITHGHSDHARAGSSLYVTNNDNILVLKHRLGKEINVKGFSYGEKINVNGVSVSFHPAGHIYGSAQVRVEYRGEVWVASGDYKLENDNFSAPFEPVPCHVFITESTFAMPVFRWKPQQEVFDEIHRWWRQNQEEKRATILLGYSLGKAQRILCNLDESIGRIYAHGAVQNINDMFRESGLPLKETLRIEPGMKGADFSTSLILAPPSALGSPWLRKFEPYSIGVASGWMRIRGNRRRRGVDRGFALSDHADWEDLNKAIEATGAEKVYVTHGYTDVLVRYLREKGMDAYEAKTYYESDPKETDEAEKL